MHRLTAAAYNAMGKINPNFEPVSPDARCQTLAAHEDVFTADPSDTILEMFSYFVNAMITISAVSFLSNVTNMPLSL